MSRWDDVEIDHCSERGPIELTYLQYLDLRSRLELAPIARPSHGVVRIQTHLDSDSLPSCDSLPPGTKKLIKQP